MKMTTIALLSAALLAFVSGCGKSEPQAQRVLPLVKVGAARQNVPFANALKVQGTIRTKNSATVSARMPGTIDAILIEEGASVEKGAALFRVDQENLANAVRVAQDDQKLAAAKLAQAKAQNEKATLDSVRMKRLFDSKAVTKDQWEKADVASKMSAAALEATQAAVTKAQTALSIAQKNLADSEVCAPFAGVITHKYKDAGDYVGPGVPVFAMDDPNVYELSLVLNAARYADVVEGMTEIILAGTTNAVKVTYKAPRVNPVTRTFEIRAAIAKSAALAPGMIVDCEVIFGRRVAQGVPTTAVAPRGGSEALFKVVKGKVVRVPVETGWTTDGWLEIRAPKLAETDEIILEGMLLVNEGDEVRTCHVSE